MTADRKLTVERKAAQDNGQLGGGLAITPNIGEDYWAYRVVLSEKQAILGFPKFGGVGIGFAVEEDWNSNLPYECDTEHIFKHIRHNKGDASISDDDVREAIRLVQEVIKADKRAADPLVASIDNLTAEQAQKALRWMARNISRDDTARAVNWAVTS
jgi:hypothetical protein